MKEIPRHSSGKINVEEMRVSIWQTNRAMATKIMHIETKIKDNKVVRRLAYFASIGFILCAAAIVLIHAGWEFATGTLGAGATMMKILSALKNL